MLSGHQGVLGDGTAVDLWVEAGEDQVSVLVMHDQEIVGRATASRSYKPGAADLTAWTNAAWRRRGVAHAALDAVVVWAREHDITYLVGEVDEHDDAARAFLARAGLLLAYRTEGQHRRFALLAAA